MLPATAFPAFALGPIFTAESAISIFLLLFEYNSKLPLPITTLSSPKVPAVPLNVIVPPSIVVFAPNDAFVVPVTLKSKLSASKCANVFDVPPYIFTPSVLTSTYSLLLVLPTVVVAPNEA